MRTTLPAVLLLLAALLLGAGCISSPNVATYQRHGFSFDYPSGWNISEERDPDGGYTLNFDVGGGSTFVVSTTSNLSVEFPATDRLDTLGVWYAESRARLLSVNATVIEERQETVAGQPAQRIVYAIRNDGVAYRSVLVVAAIGNTGYSFNLFALPASYDALSADLQTVLSSFRVDGTR
ncbi:MAG TPA: hypothetical protein HA263_00680 [Methanoregulaceae archaeon]|nr:hypothetical protein [Methanoregulaceae archaeon]